jgi:hypothetical protein
LVDRFRGGRETTLEDREREADGAGSLVVLERLGAVELLTHVLGDFLVESSFAVRELVGNSVGDTLRKERPSVELEDWIFLAHGIVHPATTKRSCGSQQSSNGPCPFLPRQPSTQQREGSIVTPQHTRQRDATVVVNMRIR